MTKVQRLPDAGVFTSGLCGRGGVVLKIHSCKRDIGVSFFRVPSNLVNVPFCEPPPKETPHKKDPYGPFEAILPSMICE